MVESDKCRQQNNLCIELKYLLNGYAVESVSSWVNILGNA